MKKYFSLLPILFLVLSLTYPQNLLATAGVPELTGKITCFARSSATVPGQGVAYTYTIGTDAFFVDSTHASAYSYSSDQSVPKSPSVTYSYGEKTNRLVLATNGYYVNFATIPLTLLYTNGLVTVDKDSKKLVTFEQSEDISSNLPACTGPVLHLPPPPAPPPPPPPADTGGDGSCTLPDTGTCTDGMKNGNETGVDTGGSCDGGITGTGQAYVPPIEHIYSTSKPVQINWHNVSLPSNFNTYVAQALKDWNKSRLIQISLEGPGYTSPMYYAEYGTDGDNAWIGAESYWAVGGGHQQGSKTEYNASMIKKLHLDEDPSYMEFLVCHEQGHLNGLGHSDINNYNFNLGGCMDYSRHPGPNEGAGVEDNTHPSQAEINRLNITYCHSH